MSDLDLDRIRAALPALGRGTAHFDGPGGSQVPTIVAQSVAEAMTSGICQRGTLTATERRTDAVVRASGWSRR